MQVKNPMEDTVITDTPEHQSYALTRLRTEYDVTAMPWLPQLPESWAVELFERIEDAERRVASPTLLHDDYYEGVATAPDQVQIIQGHDDTGILFSAEHATSPISILTGKVRFPDAGTGGLSAVLGEDFGTAAILNGKQTTNVPSVDEHPFKDTLRTFLPTADGFIAVHGMARGKFMDPSDRTEIQASLGLGKEPTEQMHEFGMQIVRAAHDELGLYVVIGNDSDYFVQKEGLAEVKTNDDGTPYRNRLAALKPNMTTNVAREALNDSGNIVPALQIELTKFLRLSALDRETRDRTSKVIGVAMGYKLLEKIVELAYTNPPESI